MGCEIAIAMLLLSRAAWLASIVFPIEQDANIPITSEQLRSVLFAAVGLFFVLDGFRHIVGSVFLLFTRPRGEGQNALAYMWQRGPENLAMGLGGAIAGAIVLFGGAHVGSPWKGLRTVYERVFGLRGSAGE